MDNLPYDEFAAYSARRHQICSKRQGKKKLLTTQVKRNRPASTSAFQYKPLDRSKGAIRLIKISPLIDGKPIECQIIRAHISTTEYIALSYVWGADTSSRTVSINGEPFHIRPNLYDFLRHAATTKMQSLFWVDAVCINQSDIEEKNSHVQHMGVIFANATKVIAWLGDRAHSPSVALHREPPREWLCCDFTEPTRSGADYQRCCDWKIPAAWSWELVRHEYWSRLWIAQELGLAKRVDILWKGRYYDWSRMKQHWNVNMHRKASLKYQGDPRSRTFARNLHYIGKLPIARYFRFVGSGPLGNLVPQFANHECQIGHDHIYGLLALARDGDAFEPDYRESPISLLFRLMNFCYDNPIAAFTKKLGIALGLEPQVRGIPVTVLGHPQLDVTSDQIQHIRYHFTDGTESVIQEDDILVRLPDTYLNFLFRPSKEHESGRSILEFVARFSLNRVLVEEAKKRFGPSRTAQWKRDQNVVLEQALEYMHKATLRFDPVTKEPRLFCDWQTVLAIFETSETEHAQGRLESRIRRWTQNLSDLVNHPTMFTI